MYEEFFCYDYSERKSVIITLLISNLFHYFAKPEKSKHFCITIDKYNCLTFTLYDSFSTAANKLVIDDHCIRYYLASEVPPNKDKFIKTYLLFDEYVNLLAEKKWFDEKLYYLNGFLTINKEYVAELQNKLEDINHRKLLILKNETYILSMSRLANMTVAEFLTYYLLEKFYGGEESGLAQYSHIQYSYITSFQFDINNGCHLFAIYNNIHDSRIKKFFFTADSQYIYYVCNDDSVDKETFLVSQYSSTDKKIAYVRMHPDNHVLINMYSRAFSNIRAADVFFLSSEGPCYINKFLNDDDLLSQPYRVMLRNSVDVDVIKEKFMAINAMLSL